MYKKFLLSAAIRVTAISPYIYYFYEHFISVRKINVACSTLPLYMLGVYYRVKLPIRVIFLLTVVLEISGITLICFSCFDNSGQLWVWRLLMLLIAYIFLYNMVCAKHRQNTQTRLASESLKMSSINSYITHDVMPSHWGRKVHRCMYFACRAIKK